MGYTTDFTGRFDLDRELDSKTFNFLTKLAETRRMRRSLSELPETGFEKYGFDNWGTEGEFFVDAEGFAGQDRDSSVLDYNSPPTTQPGLWCQWLPTNDRKSIEWNGGEKFYHYKAWLEYIICNVLEPRGYILNGTVDWHGEDPSDSGQLKVKDNVLYVESK